MQNNAVLPFMNISNVYSSVAISYKQKRAHRLRSWTQQSRKRKGKEREKGQRWNEGEIGRRKNGE